MAAVLVKLYLYTVVFEALAGFACGLRNQKSFILLLLVNLVTNPPIVWITNRLKFFLPLSAVNWIVYGILEPLVIYVEYLLYKDRLEEKISPLKLSLILNISSIIGGLICKQWIW